MLDATRLAAHLEQHETPLHFGIVLKPELPSVLGRLELLGADYAYVATSVFLCFLIATAPFDGHMSETMAGRKAAFSIGFFTTAPGGEPLRASERWARLSTIEG